MAGGTGGRGHPPPPAAKLEQCGVMEPGVVNDDDLPLAIDVAIPQRSQELERGLGVEAFFASRSEERAVRAPADTEVSDAYPRRSH